MSREATLVTDIEAGPVHDSGRIAFGPDERLYVATGDAGDGELAQDDGSLNGKSPVTAEQYRGDGEVRPEILSKGPPQPAGLRLAGRPADLHRARPERRRRPAGLRRGQRGPAGRQLRLAGGDRRRPRGLRRAAARLRGGDRAAGATFWSGDFLFATLRGEALHRLRLQGEEIAADEALLEGEYGGLRTVVEGPDGALYVLTSNQDGRGSPDDEDDRILRITLRAERLTARSASSRVA